MISRRIKPFTPSYSLCRLEYSYSKADAAVNFIIISHCFLIIVSFNIHSITPSLQPLQSTFTASSPFAGAQANRHHPIRFPQSLSLQTRNSTAFPPQSHLHSLRFPSPIPVHPSTFSSIYFALAIEYNKHKPFSTPYNPSREFTQSSLRKKARGWKKWSPAFS